MNRAEHFIQLSSTPLPRLCHSSGAPAAFSRESRPTRDGWGTSAEGMRRGWDVGRERGGGHGARPGAGSSSVLEGPEGRASRGSWVYHLRCEWRTWSGRGGFGKFHFAMLDTRPMRGILFTSPFPIISSHRFMTLQIKVRHSHVPNTSADSSRGIIRPACLFPCVTYPKRTANLQRRLRTLPDLASFSIGGSRRQGTAT